MKTIEAYGLSKKLTVDNLKKMYKTLKGFKEAKNIIKEFKPDVVIGTGGYICGATISGAHKLGIPTLLHESNAFPGKAIKILAKKTNTILVSFKDAIPRIKNARNIVFTGTPVKIKKINYSEEMKKNKIKELGLKDDKPIVLIFGGSQGAQKINEAIIEIIEKNMNKDYQVIWATGPKQYDIIKEELDNKHKNINRIENMKIVPYIYNMEEIMNLVDLIVARSGAMTVTEISNLGKPSILVPLPNVSHNHQLYNAKALENIGASKILLNDNLTGNLLNEQIEKIVLNKNILLKMGEKALSMATSNVEEKIYDEIKKVCKKGSK